MADQSEKVRLQAIVEKSLADKIDELGARTGMSRSSLIETLLQFAVEDNEWVINVVTSRYVTPVRELLRKWHKKDSVSGKAARGDVP